MGPYYQEAEVVDDDDDNDVMHGDVDEELELDYQQDTWEVVRAYFRERGLVRQQLDSFNEFTYNTIQELVTESSAVSVSSEVKGIIGSTLTTTTKYKVQFGQTYLSTPVQKEGDGTALPVNPNDARLRNLTYSSALYVDISMDRYSVDSDGNHNEEDQQNFEKTYIGEIPIMLRSKFCALDPKRKKVTDFPEIGECPYDQGGYFVVNGGEKVLVAQEKMSQNQVIIYYYLLLFILLLSLLFLGSSFQK